jgi:hypothetical protein
MIIICNVLLEKYTLRKTSADGRKFGFLEQGDLSYKRRTGHKLMEGFTSTPSIYIFYNNCIQFIL